MISRIEKIKSALSKGEALLVTSAANRRYLTGFPSSTGAVLITEQDAQLLIDFRYYEKAKQTVSACSVALCNSIYEEIKKHREIDKIYLETGETTLSDFALLKTRLEGIEVSLDNKFGKLLRDMRSVKTAEELSHIRAAQNITEEGFSYILERIEKGRTEREIALELEFFMRKRGSEGVAFDFIVVSGKNSSLPHGVPTDKPIENGDFITMDFGAVVNGYRSDMTRTVAVGSVGDEQRKVYDTVLLAQKAALGKIRAGVMGLEVDAAARDIIDGAGYVGCFGHGLGHSVGLDIHEFPSCNASSSAELAAGTIMTVEPGIYLDGRFGVRIEDMVLVTEAGCENLTHSRKDLIIL